MDCWLPADAYGPECFRTATRVHRVIDFAKIERQWRFIIEGAFIPRAIVRSGDDLRIRFSVRNDSVQEGTIYYVANLRAAYEDHRVIYSTDNSARRSRYTACIAAAATECIEVAIPWQDLEPLRSIGQPLEMTLTVELEIWTPRRMRTDRQHWRERILRVVQRGMFQRVQLMHNPVLLFGPAASSCFISYAWRGRAGLAENEHRNWAYRLADSLSLAGYQPIIDFNFLAPAMVNREVIRQQIRGSDFIIVVYSDDYLARMGQLGTGVGYEYHLLTSEAELWAKTIPVRRAVKDREGDLYALENRFVMSFEEGNLTANAAVLAHELSKRS